MNEDFRELRFRAQDDVEVFVRDYGDPDSAHVPALCLSGLTRNSKDFRDLAPHLAANGRRVLAMDYRGRGQSGYDPNWRNYNPQAYVADVLQLLTVAGLHKVGVVGTSLGGLVAMGLGAAQPASLAGVVLNDIGPEIAASGAGRIADYVGKPVVLSDLAAGAALQKESYAAAYPDLDDAGWLWMAEGTYRQRPDGQVELDYDLKLGDAVRESVKGGAPNLWPLFDALAHVPVLVIRGALSDVLSAETLTQMQTRRQEQGLPLETVVLANRGHVPILNEPPALDAIDRFFAGLDSGDASGHAG